MPNNYSVFGCYDNQRKIKEKYIKYHRLPTEKRFRDQWISACRRSGEINSEPVLICSIHFRDDDF